VIVDVFVCSDVRVGLVDVVEVFDGRVDAEYVELPDGVLEGPRVEVPL
jgi:hypothetical protein